jgi:hypothetical protein
LHTVIRGGTFVLSFQFLTPKEVMVFVFNVC